MFCAIPSTRSSSGLSRISYHHPSSYDSHPLLDGELLNHLAQEFIPHFAQEYGFQYELVTYKWPTWLRQQREKQRIIWAYKILFLDVLFPMDLDKVIFVDADQIVRADLKELIDLDLQGAPYGYTPMGDDNEDMEGFRFWKMGYWEQFLRGRPYHIR